MAPQLTQITARVPIPQHLSPNSVLSALHVYEPLITAHPYLVKYERRAVPLEDLVDDPFFRADGIKLQAYVVHERVPIIKGVASKVVVIPCVFQSFTAGTRCRADASGGVTVRSSYEVRRRGEVPLGPGEKQVATANAANGEAHEWELVEIAVIDCPSLVKPFVTHSFASAHREILQRVVDEVIAKTDLMRKGDMYS
ncbi:hypothetical protein GE09DRAFT_1173638 [Coniochaeta sp. 2T2.1]|nr:hypothetical protein GE09DRAFT_1173638 [Coniochaeta sp. 2T2.1]